MTPPRHHQPSDIEAIKAMIAAGLSYVTQVGHRAMSEKCQSDRRIARWAVLEPCIRARQTLLQRRANNFYPTLGLAREEIA
jgi:hypothetical protein